MEIDTKCHRTKYIYQRTIDQTEVLTEGDLHFLPRRSMRTGEFPLICGALDSQSDQASPLNRHRKEQEEDVWIKSIKPT